MPTHRENFYRFHNIPLTQHLSIQDISRLSGVNMNILNSVYRRGLGAAATNPASIRIKGSFLKNPNLKLYPISARLSAPQWAMARIYAYVDPISPGKNYYKQDADLRNKF
jgi:hypothetical protein